MKPSLPRHLRLDYLPPLMVYMAAGISGLTGIVSTFFVKDYLGLSAEFLAALGFWAGLPWALKMPLGHVVDLLWRWKSALVVIGASLIAASLAIILGLLGNSAWMAQMLPVETWFVISALLAPLGYVMQDVVADAMTVEAVPAVDVNGKPYDATTLKRMHTTMQTLGRVAIVGGGIAVSLVNIVLFNGIETMTPEAKVEVYQQIYRLALFIPMISVLGVVLGAVLQRRRRHLPLPPSPPANWMLLGGSGVFVLFTLVMGLSSIPYNQELIFAGSMAIVLFLMTRLFRELSPSARRSLWATAVVIFVFRALPGPGAGATWWQIDTLGFDQQFLAQLALIGSCLALGGMLIFRRFMAEKSIIYVVGFLTLAGTILSLPIVGMYYGLHQWTASLTGGMIDARFIAVMDTALESPLGQVAMIPMLAWIANSAPAHLKATFFAVMASFTNLALSLSQLGTKYLNQLYTITRAARDETASAIIAAPDYSELGALLITVTVIGFVVPMMTIVLVKKSAWQAA